MSCTIQPVTHIPVEGKESEFADAQRLITALKERMRAGGSVSEEEMEGATAALEAVSLTPLDAVGCPRDADGAASFMEAWSKGSLPDLRSIAAHLLPPDEAGLRVRAAHHVVAAPLPLSLFFPHRRCCPFFCRIGLLLDSLWISSQSRDFLRANRTTAQDARACADLLEHEMHIASRTADEPALEAQAQSVVDWLRFWAEKGFGFENI